MSFFRPSYLLNGVDPLTSITGRQCEDRKLLTLDPLRLQTVLPLFDNTGLGVGVVWDSDRGNTQESMCVQEKHTNEEENICVYEEGPQTLPISQVNWVRRVLMWFTKLEKGFVVVLL